MDNIDTRTKVGLGLTVVCGVLAFITSTDVTFLLAKGAMFIALIVFMYFGASAGFLDKRIQVIVKDVRDDRRRAYRNSLLDAMKSLGEPFELNEDPGEVAVGVETKRHLDDVKRAADGCKLKIQYQAAIGTLKYTSLEASAEMLVAITGMATPGSRVEIEGFRGKIQVDSSGSFSAQIPLSLVRKNESRGYIPARCLKGNLADDIQIPIPR